MAFKSYIKGFIYLILILGIVFINFQYAQADLLKSPWGRKNSKPIENNRPSLLTLVGNQYLKFYQKYISPVSGRQCPMHPSCSQYSYLCLKKHGAIIGVIMTADRLIHEGEEIRNCRRIIKNGQIFCYDPIEANDFWWNNKNSKIKMKNAK